MFPLKTENLWFSDDFRGNRMLLIPLSSLNIRGEIEQLDLTVELFD